MEILRTRRTVLVYKGVFFWHCSLNFRLKRVLVVIFKDVSFVLVC